MTTCEACVYVVDDDESARNAIVGTIQSAGMEAVGLPSAHEFLGHSRPPGLACLVLDVEMPELSGLELQQRLNAANDALPIVFVTGYGDVPKSVMAIKAGAVDFLTKPFDADALLDAVRRGLEQNARQHPPKASVSEPLGEPEADTERLPGIIGSSPALLQVLEQIETVARTDATVLIEGETGTGKERVARAVHDLSPRRHQRFVKVNCAAIPASLLESELLGHERGAFTGAVARRVGRFELADGGTIFLDEIGELPLEVQPKLLRILQEREFERLGGTRTLRANVRVIAATNRDLAAMALAGTFRADLYYRLNVFPIALPPLRERGRDVVLLARHFVQAFARRMGKSIEEPTAEAFERLLAHDWPGNIRELSNVLERAMILTGGGRIEVPHLITQTTAPRPSVAATPPAPTPSSSRSPSDGLAEMSRVHILRVLSETGWVISGPHGAAARLEMNRSTLSFRMKKLGIVRPGGRSSS